MHQQPEQQPSAPPSPDGAGLTSRRRVLTSAGAASAAGLVAALGPAGTAGAAGGAGSAPARVTDRARKLLAGMDLEDKLGQLFVVEVYGRSADEKNAGNRELYGVSTPAEVIAKYRPGGVIYFDERRGPDNMGDPAQVARLSNGLQRAALNTGSGVPLHVSIDQEGGSVTLRMGAPATQLPGNMALAASRSRTDTRRSAEIIGTELAAMGIKQNYAPDADVNINPANPVIGVRSFGSDAELCAQLVPEAIRGYHRSGTASAAKHFPGHGDTDTDSHTGLPVINHTREQLEKTDLPPFRAAIEAGADTIMSAHIIVPALEPDEVPATMSHRIITGLLREELGYRGLIVTDALDMSGASDSFPPDVAPVRAFLAGCDQLVLAPETDTAYAAVRKAVQDGGISAERLDASVLRILEHKLRNNLFSSPYVDADRAARVVGRRRHREDAARITDHGITLIRNEKNLLPLSGRARKVLVTGWGTEPLAALAKALGSRRGQSVTELATGAAPTAEQQRKAADAARGHDLVVVLTNAAADTSEEKGAAQAALVKALAKTGTPVVAAAVRNPYDIRSFAGAPDAYLTTYSYGAPSMTSLVRVLYGDVGPAGLLPVDIPDADDRAPALYPFGHGLHY